MVLALSKFNDKQLHSDFSCLFPVLHREFIHRNRMATCNTGRFQNIRPTPSYYASRQNKSTDPGLSLDWTMGWPNNLLNWVPGSNIMASQTDHEYSVLPSYPLSSCNAPALLGPSVPIFLTGFGQVSDSMNVFSSPSCFDNAVFMPTLLGSSNAPTLVSGSVEDIRQLQMRTPEWVTHWEHRNGSLGALGHTPYPVAGGESFGPAVAPPPLPDLPTNITAGLSALVDDTTLQSRSKTISIPHVNNFSSVHPTVPQYSEQPLSFGSSVSNVLLEGGHTPFDNATGTSNKWMEASINQDLAVTQPSHHPRFKACSVTAPPKHQTKVVSTKPPASRARKRSLGQPSNRSTYNKRRRPLNPTERRDAAAMRKLWPCVRCRMYKDKVIAPI